MWLQRNLAARPITVLYCGPSSYLSAAIDWNMRATAKLESVQLSSVNLKLNLDRTRAFVNVIQKRAPCVWKKVQERNL